MTRAHSVRLRNLALFAAVAVAAVGVVVITRDATATLVAPGHTTLVSTVPKSNTPHVRAVAGDAIDNERVNTIYDAGAKIIAGGPFTRVRNQGGTADIIRNFVFAFDEASGAVDDGFKPVVDDQVAAIIGGPTPGTVYIAGRFTNVDGQSRPKVALLNVADGSLVSTFKTPAINGQVTDIALVGDRLLVGGSFTRIGPSSPRNGLASFNANTGALDEYLTTPLTVNHSCSPGPTNCAKGPVGVEKMAVSPNGNQLVVIGNFKLAGGATHDQVVKLDLGADAATIANWNTNGFAALCNPTRWDSYVRDVAFSPDSSYFVIVTSGGPTANTLCDTATRWESGTTGAGAQPTWASYTGGDTLLSAAVSEKAVYIGGHQRWLNNNGATDTAFPGAIPRPSIAALDPLSGMPLAWNPGRHPRGFGTTELYLTPDGLWLGYDQEWMGNQQHKRERIAFLPLAGGTAPHATNIMSLPGKVYTLGRDFPNSVLHRVNAGGETIAAADGGLPWAADTQAAPSPRHNAGTGANTGRPTIANIQSMPAATPRQIFSSERFGVQAVPNLLWDFPVAAGTAVQVRLYFANRCQCAVGSRKFHVNIDNVRKLTNFDITTTFGNEVGGMRAFNITSDGNIDIDLIRVGSTALINAIEIVRTVPPPATGQENKAYVRTYDGNSTATTRVEKPIPGPWYATRGGFWAGGSIFFGMTNNLYRIPFDGNTAGAMQLLNPYSDPVWDTTPTQAAPPGQTYKGVQPNFHWEIASITGMFYRNGKLFYTQAGHTTLYWRWFSPDSGAVGALRNTIVSPINFAGSGELFTNGSDKLYMVSPGTGNLIKLDFVNDIPGGTPAVVSGPARDGQDWRAKVVFVGP